MKVTFPSLLFLVFLVLKLTHVIDWSWWWVTAPTWGFFLLLVIFFTGVEVKKALEPPEKRAARQLQELARRLRS